MALTPDDIAWKRFSVVENGYDREEVHGFLSTVGAHVRALAEARRRAQLAAASKGSPQRDPVDPSELVTDEAIALLHAAEAVVARSTRERAEAEAERIVEAARQEAERIIAEANEQADRATHEDQPSTEPEPEGDADPGTPSEDVPSRT